MKSCSRCGAGKPLSEFQKRTRSRDGLRPECRNCVSALSAEYYSRKAEAVKKKSLDYYYANLGPMKAQRSAWYERNKQVVKIRAKQWGKAHPEAGRVCVRNRRALQRQSAGRHTHKETEALMIRQGHVCANPFCRADLAIRSPHLDHMTPVSRDGSNGIENLQWLCAPCNYRKGTKTQSEWLESELFRDYRLAA